MKSNLVLQSLFWNGTDAAAGNLEVRRFRYRGHHGKDCNKNFKIKCKGEIQHEKRGIERNYHTNSDPDERG